MTDDTKLLLRMLRTSEAKVAMPKREKHEKHDE